jgi:cbb3-type cytochrome oxidase cytochrome c subunit
LNPAWFEKDQSNPDNKEPGIRVEIWDKDFIGKDEFMGYVYIPLSSLKPNLSPQYLKYDVKPRPDKKKDKVSGFINVEVTYYTRKFKEEWEAAEAKRNAEREAAEAKRNAEQKAAAEKRIAERDAKIAELTQSLGETKRAFDAFCVQ